MLLLKLCICWKLVSFWKACLDAELRCEKGVSVLEPVLAHGGLKEAGKQVFLG